MTATGARKRSTDTGPEGALEAPVARTGSKGNAGAPSSGAVRLERPRRADLLGPAGPPGGAARTGCEGSPSAREVEPGVGFALAPAARASRGQLAAVVSARARGTALPAGAGASKALATASRT